MLHSYSTSLTSYQSGLALITRSSQWTAVISAALLIQTSQSYLNLSSSVCLFGLLVLPYSHALNGGTSAGVPSLSPSPLFAILFPLIFGLSLLWKLSNLPSKSFCLINVLQIQFCTLLNPVMVFAVAYVSVWWTGLRPKLRHLFLLLRAREKQNRHNKNRTSKNKKLRELIHVVLCDRCVGIYQ